MILFQLDLCRAQNQTFQYLNISLQQSILFINWPAVLYKILKPINCNSVVIYWTSQLHWCYSAGLPISNVEVNNICSACKTGFNQWIVVKTLVKFVFQIAKFPSKTKLSFFDMQLISKSICARLHIAIT